MATTADGPVAEPESHGRFAEQAFRARQRAEQVRREAREAQRSAADSMGRSAESQDRTANAFEEAAEHSDRDRRDENLEYAARHRKFAQ